MKKLQPFFFFAAFISLIFTATVVGQTTYTSIASTEWNTPTTWSPNGTPTSIDDVIITSGFSVTITVTAGTCNNLTIQTGGALSTSLGLTVSGTFTLQAGATYTKNNASVPDLPGVTANVIDNASNVVHALGGTITTAQNPAPVNLVFGNFTDIAPTGTVPSLPMIVNGNLVVTKTGTNTLRATNSSYTNQTHTVYGTATLNSGRIICVDGTNSTGTWNFNGPSVTVNGGTFYVFASSGATGGTGTYNIDGNLIINNPGSVGFGTNSANAGTAIINLKGNLINNDPSGIKKNQGGGGTFAINLVGTSPQSWTGAFPLAFTGTTCNLNVNNGGNGVTLQNVATINGLVTLSLTSGIFTTSNVNLLTVGAGAISGGSSSSYVNGPLSRTITANGSYIFPIGKGGGYSPVSLNFTSGTYASASATVEAFNVQHPNPVLPPTDYITRFWTVSQSGISSFSCDADFEYQNGDIIGNENNIYLHKYDNPTWVTLGITNAAQNKLSATVTSFSDFWGADLAAAPVELSSFSASVKNGIVQLSWRTTTETNSSKFDVERKSADNKWMKIGEVAASGNSNSPKDYNFVDKNVMVGKYQYRIKMVDADGSYEYSNVVETEVSQPTEFSLLQNYPNPFNPITTINYSLPIDSRVSLELYSLVGEKVADLVNEAQASGFYSYNFNTSNLNLTSGVYLYKLTAVSNSNEVFSESMKMLLLK